MSIKNNIHKIIASYGEQTQHSHGDSVYCKHSIITPIQNSKNFSNDKVTFPLGMQNETYYSYIAPVEGDEQYTIGDQIYTEDEQFEICYCYPYRFQQENLYVQAILRTSKEEEMQ